MRLFSQISVLGLLTGFGLASSWFGKAAYNKWHETELERWLSDNGIPCPSPSERKDLEKLVADNWQAKNAEPYIDWDVGQLNSYLKQKGIETKNAAADKAGLITQVKSMWYKDDKSEDAWSSIKDWIFNGWSDGALKSFAEKHGISVSQQTKRETILDAIRSNYETIAKKTGETAAYPGNWLYESWTDSDLKEWLDSHGIPAIQPTSRDKLIAAVRRNSRLAGLRAADLQASASKSAADASQTITEKLLETWSESQLKEFLEKNGFKVPKGSKKADLLAIAHKNHAQVIGDEVIFSGKAYASQAAASGASAFGAATSEAGNQFGKATDAAKQKAQDEFNAAIGSWSESRLKAYLDSRGVPVPQSGKKDELIAAVRLNRNKAANGWGSWTFDTWSTDNLKAYLASSGNKAAEKVSKKAGATREQLLSAAQDSYATASKSSGSAFASVTSYLAQQTDSAKDSVFDTWSESELKNYLDSYGVPVPQGSTKNSLVAWARNQRNYFQYGTTTPQGTLLAKFRNGAYWVWGQIGIGRKQAEIAADTIKENSKYASHRADEAAQVASDKVKEEL
ncbi:hypothetical protein K3495_g7414 [Podosphaera aphanis]|nr:hypothetical protein K3495_g7414 [Podosphaera aphanis]